jgi:RNA recognition motif-containing protein
MGDPQIYIRGFPKTTTEEELRTTFSTFGDIKEVRMIRDYAFIVILRST